MMNAAGVNEALAHYGVRCEATEEQIEYLMSIISNEGNESKISWLVNLFPELDAVDMATELDSIVELLLTYKSMVRVGTENSPATVTTSVTPPTDTKEEYIDAVSHVNMSEFDISLVNSLFPTVEMEQIDYLLTILLDPHVSDDEKRSWLFSLFPDLDNDNVYMKLDLARIIGLMQKYQQCNGGGKSVGSVVECTTRTAAPYLPPTEGVNQSEETEETARARAQALKEAAKLEDITYLADIFPQIKPKLIMFVYEEKFSSHRNATADYLFELICNQTDDARQVGGAEESDNDSDSDGNSDGNSEGGGESVGVDVLKEKRLNAQIVSKLKKMKREHESKVKAAERQEYLKQRRVQEMILLRHSERAITPKYDDNGKEIRAKFDARKFTGYASLKAVKKSGGHMGLSTQFDSSLTTTRFIDNQIVTHSGERTVIIKSDKDIANAQLGPLRTRENKGSLAKANKAKATAAKKKK